MRIDQLIVQLGLVPTRSAAQRLIERKAVRWLGPKGWAVPSKAGEDVPEGATVEVTDDSELRFVSRGGLKLEGAIARCGFDVRGRTCLDVGQSTGGFTDLLLQQGATKVVGLDVGHGQLAAKLREDERVVSFEGVNARDVEGTAFAEAWPVASFGFITADVSFISLTHVLPTLFDYLAPDGDLLVLVKPQFELQPEQIGKGGIVRDKALFADVETRIRHTCRAWPMKVHGYFQSPITGGNGNTEFFLWARHPEAGDKPIAASTPPKKRAA
ncbi:23S rRNA (cytidine1920-2'-O)/16S rRNA (cytidine1409-2'-O)-methyltransferase [Sphaerotilus hippei]|uniref:23S rRNA (Cytidine1920-2'-O)/16S rRNA (Cytidine1409-2'-O)-methyltransferase n=1 Tax=Sphaerotilus hippei TaxID=744406 RepID=A0A318H5H1_9BURK|nr:TlyA family RNA methyltransferase [Sphaerotilus hippei]PXW99194.1 23S rRNA (cytidine1920-2'-O)/16S rRNA (cytidine1409-2'-O)-methyltransferase [Sphaerotilus hippei]